MRQFIADNWVGYFFIGLLFCILAYIIDWFRYKKTGKFMGFGDGPVEAVGTFGIILYLWPIVVLHQAYKGYKKYRKKES